jgi:exportin-1
VCLDYWNILVTDLFQTEANAEPAAAPLGLHIPAANGAGGQISERKKLYSVPMSKLRLLFISRMAKPEEVLIVEDENGNIVRETMKDNDVLVQYKVGCSQASISLRIC